MNMVEFDTITPPTTVVLDWEANVHPGTTVSPISIKSDGKVHTVTCHVPSIPPRLFKYLGCTTLHSYHERAWSLNGQRMHKEGAL